MTPARQLLELLPRLRALAVRAGDAVNEIRADLGKVEKKSDGSPITQADRASHKIIVEALDKLDLPYPIISEEGDLGKAQNRSESYWLIDPLDGTKEFIQGLEDFTVNIGLIIDRQPALGIVYLPAAGTVYYAVTREGAWRRKTNEDSPTKLTAPGSPCPLTAVVSRSHNSSETKKFLKKIGVKNIVARGSSLKICAVAEGEADIYPRFGPTWYWDTAAGAAIALAAGCKLTAPDTATINYNPNRTLKHSGFIFYTPKTCQPFLKQQDAIN